MKKNSIPEHVGIILDGNRRWAKRRGLNMLKGHSRGYERAIDIGEHAFDRGVKFLTLFVFSSENWKRTKHEVGYLMNLFLRKIDETGERLHKKGVKFMVIGSKKKVSKKILDAIQKAEYLTRNNKRGTLLLAFNYGGRQELVHALQEIVKDRKQPVSEKLIDHHLWTAGIPEPELIIRTSGEYRMSGFLLWQAAYSELYFTKKMWPEFTKIDFDLALEEYAKRQRRFGK